MVEMENHVFWKDLFQVCPSTSFVGVQDTTDHSFTYIRCTIQNTKISISFQGDDIIHLKSLLLIKII